MLAGLAFAAIAYTTVNLEGWTLQVESKLLGTPTWIAGRKELENQLYRIGRVVPDKPLAELRKVPIWIHENDPATKCMAYHPGPEWLREHGANPEMARGVEIANVQTFLSWTYEQPWMTLHELAHAYHFRVLSKADNNPEVKAAYDRAMASKKYEDVLHWDGKHIRHYACNNQMEYFAEATEAYFGQNDFYPFTNSELKTYDPDTFELMQKIWGTPQKRGPEIKSSSR